MAQAVPSKQQQEEVLSAPMETVAHISEEVVDKLKDVTGEVTDRWDALTKGASKNIKTARKEVTGLIKRNPLEAIAIGFSVGFLTAFLVRRIR